jgi:hypothetical protein
MKDHRVKGVEAASLHDSYTYYFGPRKMWKPIAGFEGLYEVSDQGEVRNKRFNRPVVTFVDQRGYQCVTLSSGKLRARRKVHRLVLEAFVGPCPEGMVTRHYPDRDQTNNRLANLSWATETVNQQDRVEHGTHMRGERNNKTILTEEQAREILAIKNWPRGSIVAKAQEYRISPSAISNLIRGKSWAWLRN